MGACPSNLPPRPWAFPPADSGDGDLVAVGADLAPGTVLAAYRRGLFPMAVDLPGHARLGRDGVVVARPARGAAARRAAGEPLDAPVGPPLRDPGRHRLRRGRRGLRRPDDARAAGSTTTIVSAYTELHRLGWAHSVEAWRDGELAGGLYGVAIGGLFAGESMFTRVRDASKVALMGLVDLLSDEYAGARLLDTQWQTPHLATLGVVEIPRADVPGPPRARRSSSRCPRAFRLSGTVLRRRAGRRRRRRPSGDRPRPSRSSRRRG